MAWMMLILTGEFCGGAVACVMLLRAQRKVSYQAKTIEIQIDHINELRSMIGEISQELP